MKILEKAIRTHVSLKTLDLVDTGISIKQRTRLRRVVERLKSERALFLTTICSTKMFGRFGARSSIARLPMELIRLLGTALG